jgi:hypothetical protein
MTSVRATSVVPNKGKESAESEGEVRALQSRRRVGAGRFLEPLASSAPTISHVSADEG